MKNNDYLFSDSQNLCNTVSDWLIQKISNPIETNETVFCACCHIVCDTVEPVKPTGRVVPTIQSFVAVRVCSSSLDYKLKVVWLLRSEPSLCAQWVAKDPSSLHADSEDSDQTGWMPRLIWVFTGRTFHFLAHLSR